MHAGFLKRFTLIEWLVFAAIAVILIGTVASTIHTAEMKSRCRAAGGHWRRCGDERYLKCPVCEARAVLAEIGEG